MAGLKGGLGGFYVDRIILIFEGIKMNKIFMGLLAVAALALIVSQAIAGASNTNNASNAPANADNGGVMIIETYSASAVTVPGNYNSNSNANAAGNNSDMQPLPGDPGVEVAPGNSTAGQPVVVEEEEVLVQETEDGE